MTRITRNQKRNLLNEYCKAIDALTISEENRLRKRVSALEEKENEIQSLKRELADVKESMEGMAQVPADQIMELRQRLEELRRSMTGHVKSRHKNITKQA